MTQEKSFVQEEWGKELGTQDSQGAWERERGIVDLQVQNSDFFLSMTMDGVQCAIIERTK